MGILRSSLARLRKNSKSCLSKSKPSENVSESPQTIEKEKAVGSNDNSSPPADQGHNEPGPSDGTNGPKRRKRDLLKKCFKGIGWAGVGLLAIPLVPLVIVVSICSDFLGLILSALWSLILKPLLLLIVLPYELLRACFC